MWCSLKGLRSKKAGGEKLRKDRRTQQKEEKYLMPVKLE
jgi:hypothetical protein